MKAIIPSASISLLPNIAKSPSNSLIKPMAVRDIVKPSPIPMPSNAESRMEFLFANASALPRTIQLTTISGMKSPRVA